MKVKRIISTMLTAGVCLGAFATFAAPEAQAKSYWQDKHGRVHTNNGRQFYYDKRRSSWVDYKTGKILKGGLIGAGIGAGTALLFDRNVGKGVLTGAGIGAGAQAIRYSETMQRHPIAKTAAYGALTGVGVNAIRNKGLGQGALWGGGIGAGVGALRDLR